MSDEDEGGGAGSLTRRVDPVEGAPLARVSSRLTWPKEKSEVDRLEGESVIRTPTDPANCPPCSRTSMKRTSSATRNSEANVRDVIGTGPIPTADE